MDPDLLAQFRDAERALRALGIVTWPMVEDEADDGLATATARFIGDPRVEQIVICSVDKDLGQCVEGERVVLRDRMRQRHLRRGRHPRQVRRGAGEHPRLPGPGGRLVRRLSRVCRAGAPRARPPCSRAGMHLEQIPDSPLDWEVPLRGAVGAGRHAARPSGGGGALQAPGHAQRRRGRRRAAGRPRVARRARATEFLALCAELGFETVGSRVHRWRVGPSGQDHRWVLVRCGAVYGRGPMSRRLVRSRLAGRAADPGQRGARPAAAGRRRVVLRLDLVEHAAAQHPRLPPCHRRGRDRRTSRPTPRTCCHASGSAHGRPQSLRSGALAVKHYAWYQVLHWRGGTNATAQCFDLRDDTVDQVYDPSQPTYTTAAAAVDATWSMRVLKNGADLSDLLQRRRVRRGVRRERQRLEACTSGAPRPAAWPARPPAQIMLTYYYPGVTVSGSGPIRLRRRRPPPPRSRPSADATAKRRRRRPHRPRSVLSGTRPVRHRNAQAEAKPHARPTPAPTHRHPDPDAGTRRWPPHHRPSSCPVAASRAWGRRHRRRRRRTTPSRS